MPKLKNLLINQQGVVHLLVTMILLVGIIAGTYLVLEGPKIFKPKAYEQSLSGPVNYLPAPSNLQVSCSSDNKTVTYSWSSVPGSDKYHVRVNKQPFEVWNPGDKSTGDYSRLAYGNSNTSHYDAVSPNVDYKFSVQALPAGVEYSPQGNLSEWKLFNCGAQQATLSMSPTTLLSDGTLNVSWSGISNPNLADYINITTADDQHGVTSHTYWINNNCTWFKSTSGTPRSSGSCTISLKNDQINTAFAGPYHLVLYSGITPDTTTILAKSNNFNLIKRVFVTSTNYNGNLADSFSGLSGADKKCLDRAYAANLGGNWKAWLSIAPADYPTSAASRLTHNSGSYQLLNGVTVADNWTDLTDGTLKAAITISELGSDPRTSWAPYYESEVWTNTHFNGSSLGGQNNCNNFTSASGNVYSVGSMGSTTWWSGISTSGTTCAEPRRLYCFEQ